VMAPLAVP